MTKPNWLKTDYLGVALIGVIALMISYMLLYQGATLSDEVVYAVIARNIVEKNTLNTNVYRADSIVLRGYPRRDHHMPGYPLTLAGFFALFGVDDKVVVGIPGQIAYILAGLVFYGVGKTLFKPTIAFWATLLFYLYPVSFVSANLVLVEAPLHLIALIYVAVWFKLSRTDTLKMIDVIILAVVLVVGMVYRETMIIFLPPALFLLAKHGWTRQDYRPLVGFSLLFALLVVGVFWPLSQQRGYYPFPFNQAVEAPNLNEKISIIMAGILENISPTARILDAYYYAAILNLVFGLGMTFLGLWRWRVLPKKLVGLSIYLFWSALILLTVLHTNIFDWATPRHMFTFLFPGLWLIMGAIFTFKQSWRRTTAIAVTILVAVVSSWQVSQATARYQERTIGYQQFLSNTITQYLSPYAPQSVLFSKAFTSAWEHYPMTLVWTYPGNYEEMQILQEQLPIDAIVVTNEQQRDVILDAGRAGILKEKYTSLFPYKVDGFYFLVNERLQPHTSTE